MKPSLPQGTRDFSAAVVQKRNYIFNTIRTAFELYGFQPLETPAMENLETLTGKYGDEGDKLIFKILNNGLNDAKNIEKAKQAFENILHGKNDTNLTERALRYDLTIPFARFVAMNYHQLHFPFRRYQMQPVWRADRPQKGRYREFYQCDADIAGSKSLLNEAELASLYITIFEKLKINVEIKINSRNILTALAQSCHAQDKLIYITTAIDKIDKTGIEKVKEELTENGLNEIQVNFIENYLSIKGNNEEKLSALEKLINNNAYCNKGIEEIKTLLSFQPQLTIDFTLARGLNYYTGIIFEVKAKDVSIGSIGGGGRYDDLTGIFGVPNLPGVGISFGVERIYDVMEELNLFPPGISNSTQVLFFNLGEKESNYAFTIMQQLRQAKISCELYCEPAKFDKQFKYADKKNIQYAVIIGAKEMEEKTCNLKNLKTGEQQTIALDTLFAYTF